MKIEINSYEDFESCAPTKKERDYMLFKAIKAVGEDVKRLADKVENIDDRTACNIDAMEDKVSSLVKEEIEHLRKDIDDKYIKKGKLYFWLVSTISLLIGSKILPMDVSLTLKAWLKWLIGGLPGM